MLLKPRSGASLALGGLMLLTGVFWAIGPNARTLSSDQTERSQPPAKTVYRTEANIAYRTEPGLSEYARKQCQLDLYYPTDTTDFATVLWFHGGGLTKGKRSVPSVLQRKGFAVVAVGYRLSPEVKAPLYIEDAAAAVAWTFQNIEKYGGSTKRIFLAGHSAGGYLTLMVGLDQRWLQAHGLEANQLAGLIPLSGQAITHFTIRAERGIANTRPLIDEFAPLFHVRKDAPPLLLVTGDRHKELLGRYEENAYLWRMLREVGHPRNELLELQGFDHGEMVQPAFPLLVRFVQEMNKDLAPRRR